MALGQQIRLYRMRRGWTLEQLEEASGVDKGTLSALELRNSKRSNFTGQIAQALGLTSEQLLDTEVNHYAVMREPEPPRYGTDGSESPSVGAPVPISSASGKKVSTWPFATSLSEVLMLSERDIGRIDGFMHALVMAHVSARKSVG